MAVEARINSIRCNMKLNNGLDSAGNVKTLNVSLGTLNKDAWDAQKAMNIVELARPCFSRTVYSTEKTESDTLVVQD